MTELNLIGYGVRDGEPYPIYQMAGAAIEVVADDGDDDDPDPTDLDGADDGDDDEDEPQSGATRRRPTPPPKGQQDDGWKPPTRQEWKRTQDAIRRNNQENRKLRQLKTQATSLGIDDFETWLEERGIDPKTGGKLTDQPDAADDATDDGKQDPTPTRKPTTDVAMVRRLRAAEREAARAELKYKPVVVKLSAENALRAAGFTGERIDRVMKLVDTEEIDVDEDGQVTGLQEQIDGIKDEFPEWFRARSRRVPRRNNADEDDTDAPEDRRSRGTGRGTRLVGGGDQRNNGPTPTWLEQVDASLS